MNGAVLAMLCLLPTSAATQKGASFMDQAERNVTLGCAPDFQRERVQIRYSITNSSAEDIYALDVFSGWDNTANKPYADYQSVYICWRASGAAFLLKGITPLPPFAVTVRNFPVGTKIAPGDKLDRQLEIGLPLKEGSPYYYGPLKPEEYQAVDVSRFIFAVDFMRSSVEGFTARGTPEGPDLYLVRGKSTPAQAERLTCEFGGPTVKLLKRTDAFTRLDQ